MCRKMANGSSGLPTNGRSVHASCVPTKPNTTIQMYSRPMLADFCGGTCKAGRIGAGTGAAPLGCGGAARLACAAPVTAPAGTATGAGAGAGSGVGTGAGTGAAAAGRGPGRARR